MEITKLISSDIVCEGCANAIKKALEKLNGVLKVEVNVESKIVTVEHSAELTKEKIVDELEKAGFSPTNEINTDDKNNLK